MPPIPRISKELVLKTAFALVRAQGIEALNARELAKALGCSTHPIFRVYESMEALKAEVYKKAEDYYNQRMWQGLSHENPFLGMGLAYVAFAREERQLFRLLFLSEAFAIHSFEDMIHGEDNEEVVQMIAGGTGCTHEQSRRLLVDIWLLMHGMATMIATNSADISEAEVEDILKRGFRGFLAGEREKDNDA